MFALAATEAYINEVSHLVKQDSYLYPNTPLVDFGAEMTQAVGSKAPIEEEYLLASKLLARSAVRQRQETVSGPSCPDCRAQPVNAHDASTLNGRYQS